VKNPPCDTASCQNSLITCYIIMAALYNRAGHYIFALWFLSFLFYLFFPRVISAVGDWMSTVLPHMVWRLSPYCEFRMHVMMSEMCYMWLTENTGCKNDAKNRHLGTNAQLCWAISSQLRHVSTTRKKLVKQQYVLHMCPQYGELRPING